MTIDTEEGKIVSYGLGLPEKCDVSLAAAIMMDQMNAMTKANKGVKVERRYRLVLRTIYYLFMLRYNSRIAILVAKKKRVTMMIAAYLNGKRSERVAEKVKKVMQVK